MDMILMICAESTSNNLAITAKRNAGQQWKDTIEFQIGKTLTMDFRSNFPINQVEATQTTHKHLHLHLHLHPIVISLVTHIGEVH